MKEAPIWCEQYKYQILYLSLSIPTYPEQSTSLPKIFKVENLHYRDSFLFTW